MNSKNFQSGFGPLVIIVVIAIAAALGGGIYYTTKHSAAKKQPTPTPEASVSPSASPEARKTLKDLLSLAGNVTCTVSQSAGGNVSSGTVYISGSNMRGDFTTKASTTSAVQSHIIRKQDDI